MQPHTRRITTEQSTHTQLHTQWISRESLQGGPPRKESNVGCGWVTYYLREDKKHARARRGAQSSREIPTHVEPRVIEQKERPTPTQHHTRTHTPQAKHVCTRPTPPRTHRTTTEQRKPTHDYTHSELAERACKGAPQWKNQMWGPNQQLPRSQSGQSVSRVLGLVHNSTASSTLSPALPLCAWSPDTDAHIHIYKQGSTCTAVP